MKLFIFGQEINPDYELELIIDDDLGLNIIIKYKNNIFNGIKETKHNYTKFHHLYNINHIDNKFTEQLLSAFESNIHCTGFTEKINKIEWIKIEKAIFLYKKY